MVTTQHPYAKTAVTAQIALDLFENKEKALIGQIKGELSSYHKCFISQAVL